MAIFGTNASDIIDWWDGVTNGADTIFGLGGDDIILAEGGNDTILGGLGADWINGGVDNDTASYSDSAEGVVVSLVSGEGFGGTAEGDTLVSIENLTGSNHADLLVGNDLANILNGGGNNDSLKGGGGADELNGGSGNDKLKGGGGADEINGGSGIDTASYEDSNAGVFVNLNTGVGDGGYAEGDALTSIENLTGSDHNDNLWGNNGANVLKGLDGDDSLKGFGGADRLEGGDNNDTLYGMDGNDTLVGGNGNDWLNGGANVDTMTGGAGADTFYFYAMADSAFGTPDHITDFNDLVEATTDKIDLHSIDADTTQAGNQAFIWIGNNNEWTDDYGAGQLRFNGGYLEGDVDGDHNADFRIEVDGVPVIHDYAFIL